MHEVKEIDNNPDDEIENSKKRSGEMDKVESEELLELQHSRCFSKVQPSDALNRSVRTVV